MNQIQTRYEDLFENSMKSINTNQNRNINYMKQYDMNFNGSKNSYLFKTHLLNTNAQSMNKSNQKEQEIPGMNRIKEKYQVDLSFNQEDEESDQKEKSNRNNESGRIDTLEILENQDKQSQNLKWKQMRVQKLQKERKERREMREKDKGRKKMNINQKQLMLN